MNNYLWYNITKTWNFIQEATLKWLLSTLNMSTYDLCISYSFLYHTAENRLSEKSYKLIKKKSTLSTDLNL